MQKITTGLLLSLFVTAAATAQETVTITGHVTGDTKGYNKVFVYGTNIKRDSAVIANGTFSFTIPYTPDITPVMYTEYEAKVKKSVAPFAAIIDKPCNITLSNIDIEKGLHSGTWSGNACTETYQTFSKGLSEVTEGVRKTMQEKMPGKDGNDSTYRAVYTKLNKEKLGPYVTGFIKSHPDSYATVIALRGTRSSMNDADVEKAYALLGRKQKASTAGKEIEDYIAGLKSGSIGNKVQDFTLPPPDDKTLTFSSLKGKYVVIDFWASWCGPCKASFPHMKEVYNKFKGDKFEIYSISIDKDKEAWLKELGNQQLPWLQTLDTKNINQRSFAVIGVPTTFLVSPEGKIMLKEVGFNPKGGAIEKKLEEVLMN